MEEILSKFSSALTADIQKGADKQNLNHAHFYKTCWDIQAGQEKRRSLMLSAQKEKRNAQVDALRGIFELVRKAESANENSAYPAYKPKVHVPGFHKKPSQAVKYDKTLMLSEWMYKLPEDLSENWLALACPKGTRVLIVASRGNTKAYKKNGNFLMSWNSYLPGGVLGRSDSHKLCVLDAVWSDLRQAFFVLDVLAWDRQSFTDCDVDFRDFWLKSKFSESSQSLSVAGDFNEYPIYLTSKHRCTRESLNNLVATFPVYSDNVPEVDGFLFYHKEACYVGGSTPLVVWLFPFMINEVIDSELTVHEAYKNQRPLDYKDAASYIKEFDEKLASKTKYERRRVHSFSSVSSNSSFNSSNTSDISFGSGKVHMVFGAKSKETEDIDFAKEKKLQRNRRKKYNKRNQMDVEASTSCLSDSAISSMEDSILEQTEGLLDQQEINKDNQIETQMDS